ncbi:hypothetical protein IQ243_06965 [Nostocales cyanobacterium LEGE 11386]|nr:hypothetical protein [Nostocales cyanobacterium LEGE 11386]
MDVVRKINDELAIAGQSTLQQFQLIADDGYKSVLNLRSPDEQDFLAHEQEKIEFLGLQYVNFPINAEEINHQLVLQLFPIISELPKPILIHCDNAIRAAAIVFLYIATKQGINFEKALQKAINLELL